MCKPGGGLPMEYRLSDNGMEGYSQDGITLWQGEPWHGLSGPTILDITRLASKEPDHEWRVFCYGPLWNTVYKFNEAGLWELESVTDGYA